MLEFEECELSGNLRANGDKGTYWLMSEAWSYLELVTPTPAGPKIEKLGSFNNDEDAIDEANRFDTAEEEEE